MKLYVLLAAMLLSGSIAFAQQDPVVMTVAGHPVTRSQFEQSYDIANRHGGVGKISVADFARLFADYKLKVQAALDAHLDSTLWLGGDEAVLDSEAQIVYQDMQQRMIKNGGAVKTSQILVRLDQKASAQEENRARLKADSIYRAYRNGANFDMLAYRYSDDKGTAHDGGRMPWIQRGQTVKAYENTAFSMKVGEVSKPILSELGYHIIRLDDKRNAVPYDSLKTIIYSCVDSRNIRNRILTEQEKIQYQAKTETTGKKKITKPVSEDLLVYEITNRQVWSKAVLDEATLKAFFDKNKKRYKSSKPYFKGRGKKLRKTPSDYTQVKSWVIADYQDQLEKEWVANLRKKYVVVVNQNVLATVNKH